MTRRGEIAYLRPRQLFPGRAPHREHHAGGRYPAEATYRVPLLTAA
ncbi:MAG TPA: hypothetical protein VMG55_04365 [Stellaceae bacterium]|nr:hypothetical protein [Stellaceae bacterium]